MSEEKKRCPSTFLGQADLRQAQSKQTVIETKNKLDEQTQNVFVGHNDHTPLRRIQTRGPRDCSHTSRRPGASS